jgi:hypothetical protein
MRPPFGLYIPLKRIFWYNIWMPSNQHTNDRSAPKMQLMSELLYDALMKHIEPELMTNRVPWLDFLYAGETPAERKTRMERYAKAMIVFDDRMKELQGAWEHEVKTLRDNLLAGVKHVSSVQDSGALDFIADQISNS